MTRKSFLAMVGLAMLFSLLTAPTAHAAEGVIWHDKGSWKNCEQRTSRISTTGKFHAFDYGGKGNYYVKWTLKWQKPVLGGGWRALDNASGQGQKFSVKRGSQEVFAHIADKTGWGNAYDYDWRVWIRITLYKADAGPDTRYLRDRIEKSYYKPRFPGAGGGGICSMSP